MSIIIGFVGKKGSGKTLCADYLVNKYGFEKVNFKDALVEEIKERFPHTLKILAREKGMTERELFEKKPPIMRELIQNYGTEVRRGDFDKYWIFKWGDRLAKIPKKKNVVVDDVRFINESEAVLAEEGMLVRIMRPALNSTDQHISEIEMNKIKVDKKIINKGSINELYKILDKMINL